MLIRLLRWLGVHVHEPVADRENWRWTCAMCPKIASVDAGLGLYAPFDWRDPCDVDG
jgi:hypothetical protein